MLHTYKAIVLHTIKYKDNAVIVQLYTQEVGRIAATVTLSHTPKAKLKTALFQPLSVIEVVVAERPTADLLRIREARAHYVFSSLPYDAVKSSIALFVAEFLHRTLRATDQDVAVFDYLYHSILWLDTCETSYANFHLVFLMRFAKFLGLHPNIEEYERGMLFDLSTGNFTLSPLTQETCLSVEDSQRISLFMRMNYDTMRIFKFSRQERGRVLDILMNYYRLHIPDFGELKSYAVLRTLFDTSEE